MNNMAHFAFAAELGPMMAACMCQSTLFACPVPDLLAITAAMHGNHFCHASGPDCENFFF